MIKKFFRKVASFYAFFLRSPKTFKRPSKADILIYDASGVEVLTPYFYGYSVEILQIRNESMNVSCMIRSLSHKKFWQGDPLTAYTDAFIQSVNPKLIITFIDNNSNFYTIKSRFPEINTVFVQNGSRTEICDIFGSIEPDEKFKVDYMVVHTHAVGAKYQTFISGEIKVAGAFKSNEVPVNNDYQKRTVLFISQWHDANGIDDLPICKTRDGLDYLWREFYDAETFLLTFLNNYCREKKLQLKICGRQSSGRGEERDYFIGLLGDSGWEYIPKSKKYNPYEVVDSAEVVVFIDSTLGYEAIGRRKKTAGFSIRGNPLNKTDNKFGWPLPFPDNGLFWTNLRDEKEYRRVMDYLLSISDDEWEKTLQQYSGDLMELDPGNTRFIKLLQQLLPQPVNV